jgi:hypothetical protein
MQRPPQAAQGERRPAPTQKMDEQRPPQAAQTETKPAPSSKPGASGQSQADHAMEPKDGEHGATNKSDRETQREPGDRDQPRNAEQQPRNGEEQPGKAAAGSAPQGGKATQLSDSQRTRIKNVVDKSHLTRIDHADFSVSVGAVVPRSVHLAVLPPEIIEVVPEYRGYSYVLIGDELVIIDPHSYAVVVVLEG